MKILYSITIRLYGFLLSVVALFNDRARKLLRGQRAALSELKKKIDPTARYVWIHAASLGEFEQGRPLIEKIKEEKPEIKILLTFYSPSGYEVRKTYDKADVVCYLPLDSPAAAREFVETVQIQAAVFIKYEIWPSFLQALQKAEVPTYLISAIFRPNQVFFKSYGKSYLALLKSFRHIFVQDDPSAVLLKNNGLSQLTVCGDTRFDRVCALAEIAKQIPLVESFVDDKTVVVAGSTWEKDEQLLVEYLNQNPEIKIIIAPHETTEVRILGIEKMLFGRSVRYTQADKVDLKQANCLIIDTIGLLSSVYRYGTLAYVGGGFGVGIHNTLEAAVYGIPVVFGPNYQKFREARELVAFGGGFSIENYADLKERFDKLLKQPAQSGEIAGAYVQNNRGATDQIYKALDL